MFCHYFILLLCVFAYCNQDGEWFNCKPKPGCSIARCDPIPAGQWFGNDGVSNEYPILCQQNEASSSVTADTEIVDQLQEIRIQLAKLEGRLEKSEKVEFEMKFDITLLERKNAEIKKEAEEGKRQLNGAMKQITSIEKTNSEMRNEMDSMKKKAEEDKGKLNGAMKKITSLEKTNSEMRNEMNSMKKTAEEDKGKLNGAMKNPEEIECEDGIIYRRKCYFAFVHPRRDVPLRNAQNICERNHGKLADILDREHQRLIINYLRPKIPPSSQSYVQMNIWVGMLYQISTKTLQWSDGTVVDAPLNWYGPYPLYEFTRTNVGIIVSKVTTATSNGLFHVSPTYSTYGAVCEK